MTSEDLFSKCALPISYLKLESISRFQETIRSEFKARMGSDGKSEIVMFDYYPPFIDFGWLIENEDEVPSFSYTHMPADDFRAIEGVLKEVNLADHADPIASLLRTYYCRQLLAKEHASDFNNYKNFIKEYIDFYKLLTEDEIVEIKLLSHRMGSFKNKNFIKLIIKSFAEKILKMEESVDLIDIFSTTSKDFNTEEDFKKGATINLLIYIQTQTDFTENIVIEESKKLSFSHVQCELIYDLLVAGSLINDKDISSPPKDYIGNFIRRSIEKKPEIEALFSNPIKLKSTPNVPTSMDLNSFFTLNQENDKRRAEIESRIEKIINLD